jgi:hypothetical protein
LVSDQYVARLNAISTSLIFVTKPARNSEEDNYLGPEFFHERQDIPHYWNVGSVGGLHQYHVPISITHTCSTCSDEITGASDVFRKAEHLLGSRKLLVDDRDESYASAAKPTSRGQEDCVWCGRWRAIGLAVAHRQAGEQRQFAHPGADE